MRDKECYFCDCYDEDFGCTMPAIDKVYACPLNQEIERDSDIVSDSVQSLD